MESLFDKTGNLAKKVSLKLAAFKEDFDPLLANFLAREIEKTRTLEPEISRFLEIGAEFTKRRGKRLRPAFVFEGNKAFGGKQDFSVLSVAIAIELLHAAVLIHDDIIDNSDLRRGEPTVHKVIARYYQDGTLGRSLAIVMGDTLIALANKTVSEVSDSKRGQFVNKLFQQMCIEINNGQYLDILGSLKSEVDRKWIMQMMELKTARYTVEKPLLMGAVLAGASDDDLKHLSNYAIPIGIAFQLQDDILGMFGDEEKVGKPVGSDLKEGKKTLLVLETVERLAGRSMDVERFRSILGNSYLSRQDYKWVQEVMIKVDAVKATQELAEELINQAKDTLNQVKNISHDSRDYFLGIADFVLGRAY